MTVIPFTWVNVMRLVIAVVIANFLKGVNVNYPL